MKKHRGHRVAWPRKTSPVEAANASVLLNTLPTRNVVKDESSTWTETVDVSFFDANNKIFQWDDSGALDSLKKAEGISSVDSDHLNDSNQFSASINWDERWLCTLPDCASDLASRDEKIKNSKGSSTRRDPSDSASAVILGLPEPQNGSGCSISSLHLPLHVMPLPTGWDEGEDNPADARWEDLPVQPLTATYPRETQVEPTSQSWWHALTNSNEVPRIPGSGWPKDSNSYQHIIPSGWEDVQADQPVVSSSWGTLDRESRSYIQTHQPSIRGCDYPSYGSRPTWRHPHASAESHPVYGKSHSGQQQDFYNKSHKYAYWRPKRQSQTNNHESSARRSMQRPGR